MCGHKAILTIGLRGLVVDHLEAPYGSRQFVGLGDDRHVRGVEISMATFSDEQLRATLEPLTLDWNSRSGLRDAAVLVPWFVRDGKDFILYTKRTEHLRAHAGEVSFPGGAREGSEDALACALRESSEEIGLDSGSVVILGCLPDMVSIAGYLVRLFVGRVSPPDDLKLDRTEVERVIEVSIGDLQCDEKWEWRTLEAPPLRRTLPFFDIGGCELWGLTALFTRELLCRIEKA